MLFKKYSNILGEPNSGFHQLRFLDTAILDYIGTILLSILLTIVIGKNKKNKYHLPLVLSTIITFTIGVFLHYLFDVKTNIIKLIS